MSELKFRAWDKSRKEFFTHPNWVEWQIDLNGVLTAKNIKFPQGVYQNLEISQYTGLKDKNGKEIYEGDIIKYEKTKNNFIYGVLKMCPEFLGWMFVNKDDIPMLYPKKENSKWWEVVGNI